MAEPIQENSQPPRKSSRRWLWLIPVFCVIPLLCCGGFVATILMVVFGSMKSSEPYQKAVAAAQSSPEVRASLGAPVEPGFFVTGKIHFNGSSGNADLSIPVSGPNGQGTITVIAAKAGGPWEYSKMEFVDSQGTRVNLLEPATEEASAQSSLHIFR